MDKMDILNITLLPERTTRGNQEVKSDKHLLMVVGWYVIVVITEVAEASLLFTDRLSQALKLIEADNPASKSIGSSPPGREWTHYVMIIRWTDKPAAPPPTDRTFVCSSTLFQS